jgi:hypothetical protein
MLRTRAVLNLELEPENQELVEAVEPVKWAK